MASDLPEQWRKHLALDRRRSIHTVRAYVATAERLVAFLEGHHGQAVTAPMLARLEQADLRAFLTVRRADGIGNLSASAGYKVNDWMSISLDALNLNDPTLKYSSKVGDQMLPYAFYSNGRQYYVNLRFKF